MGAGKGLGDARGTPRGLSLGPRGCSVMVPGLGTEGQHSGWPLNPLAFLCLALPEPN